MAPKRKGRVVHEQPPPRTPGTVSGKRPTEASLQRAREYKDWLIALPVPVNQDSDRDESYEAFMKERRKQREAARSLQRRVERQQARGSQSTPQEQEEQEEQFLSLIHI